MKKISLLCVALIFCALHVQGKEMNHRLGVGPKAPFTIADDLQSIGVHYFPNTTYEVTGALGINTVEGSSALGLQGGIRRIMFEEKNLNFFVGGALGLISKEVSNKNYSGFELLATAGGEYFFEGLENLGFNFELGLGVASFSDSNRFFTMTRHPLNAGIIFYF